MKSSKVKVCLFLLWIIAGMMPECGSAQPSAILSAYLNKYPDNMVIIESQNEDITVKLNRDDKPLINFRQYRSLFVLSDNATRLSEGSDYFSATQELLEFKAYSLIPGEKSYKKKEAGDYIKAAEVRDNIFYDDLYSFKFNFPAVAKGVKLVTESETVSKDPFFPIIFYFGANMPVESTTLTLTIPEKINIIYKLFGYDTSEVKMSRTKDGRNIIYKWTSTNPKDYSTDEYSPDHQYFVPHIIVSIVDYPGKEGQVKVIGSLQDLYNWEYGHVNKTNIETSQALKQLADSITQGLEKPEEKVKHIFQWVQQNIHYIAIEDGDNGHVPRDADLVLSRRYGDCKDKTSLLVALIRSIGEKASFGWVGSHSLPYRYSDFPGVNNSNHMIACWWDSNLKPVLLDGTTLYHSFGQIPTSIQGKQCLLEKGSNDFLLYDIPLKPASENASIDTIYLSLNKMVLQGEGRVRYSGELKSQRLYSFATADSAKCRKKLLTVKPMFSNKFTYTYCKPGDVNIIDQDLKVDYGYSLPDYCSMKDGNTFINMNLERKMGNVNIRTDRWLPVDIETPFDHQFVSVLHIPTDMTVKTLPEDASWTGTNFRFIQHYSRQGDDVILSTRIVVDCQLIEGKEVEQYRQMILALNKAYSKSLILSKKL